MAIYPYSFTMPPVNKQDIPSDGVVGEFLGISAGGVLDWLPVAGGGGGGDMLKADNLSGLADYAIARTNIGLGLTSSPEFANLTLTSPSLASSAPVTISQTWNNAAVAFTGVKVNAVNTASAAASLLLDLQVGGASKFKVDKDGAITTQAIFALNTSLQFIFAGNRSVMLGIGDLRVSGGSTIGWSSNGTHADGGPPDTILLRDGAANTLALRNGGAAQTFNVYGTYTSVTDYKRLSLSCSASTGNATIGVPFNSVLAVTGGSAPSTTATITFATQAAAFPVGSSVVVAGVTPSGYNGTYVVTASTTSSVSYTVGGALAAWSSGGTATVSGSAALTLTGAGNLGIGTTAPGSTLTVAGTFHFGSDNGALPGGTSYGGHMGATSFFALRSNNSASTSLYLQNTGGGSKNAEFRLLGSGAGADFGAINLRTIESSPITFDTNLTEKMRITAAGNVGIGTTAPSANLELYGNSGQTVLKITSIAPGTGSNLIFNGAFGQLNNNAGSFFITNESATDPVIFRAGGQVERMRITSTGNVGIGTTSPTSKLHVAETWNNAGTAFCAIKSVITDTNSAAGSDFLELYSGTSTQPLRMDINKTGQINIYGAWTDASNYERLSFNAPSAANAVIGTNKAGTGTARGLEFQTDGVTRMTLGTNGSATFAALVEITGSSGLKLPATGYGIYWTASTTFNNRSNGVLTISNFAENDFGRLQFGGTTDAFPAIARDGAGIKFTGAAAGATAWIKVPPVAVSALPLAATAGAGARAFVNDALAPTFGSAVTGGGAVLVPVYSDGSAWNVG